MGSQGNGISRLAVLPILNDYKHSVQAAAIIDAMRKHGTVAVKLKDKSISESVMEKVKSVCLHNAMSRGNAAVIKSGIRSGSL